MRRMNLRAKITTCVWAGTCFTLISAGSALAAEPKAEIMSYAVVEQGGGVSAYDVGHYGVSDPLLVDKHREVDAYIFDAGGLETYRESGFTVTHTGPRDGVIEIGIAPYEAAYADKLYARFGSEQVVVVEGTQATTLIAPADGALSSPASSDDQSAVSILVVGGPEPGEGEAAITSFEPDLDMPVDDGGAIQVEPIVEGDLSIEVEPIFAPDDDVMIEEAPISTPEDAIEVVADIDTTAELELVAASAEGTWSKIANVWPWVAAVAAVAAGAFVVIRKLVISKR